jgi:hypothetical protein
VVAFVVAGLPGNDALIGKADGTTVKFPYCPFRIHSVRNRRAVQFVAHCDACMCKQTMSLRG